jgi:hypothetical protein
MKPQMLIGAILTAIGIIVVAVGGFIDYTTRETIPHEGSVKLTAKREKVISIPPAVGGLALAGGIVLMVLAARK